jgi:hypothetical protein
MSDIVTVGYDEAARRYYVISSDIAGLNVETDTFEEFVEVVSSPPSAIMPPEPKSNSNEKSRSPDGWKSLSGVTVGSGLR